MEEIRLPSWLTESFSSPPPQGGRGRRGLPLSIEKNLGVSSVITRGGFFGSGERPSENGFSLLQSIEPRARVSGVFVTAFAAVVSGRPVFLLALLLLAALLAFLSGVKISSLAKKAFPAFAFTSVIAVPVFFSFLSPGTQLIGFSVKGFTVSVTVEGVAAGLFFILRVVTVASLVGLLLLTTMERDFFRGLRGLPVPSFFMTALYMTLRYVYVLLKLAEEAALGRRSRTINRASLRQSRSWFATRVALFLDRALHAAEEISLAMTSRGFGGKVKTFIPDPLAGKDYLFLGFSFFVFFLCLGLSG